MSTFAALDPDAVALIVGRLLPIPMRSLLRIAADLMSQDGENPEYDRACVEIMTEALGLPISDHRDGVEAVLRAIQRRQWEGER